jgi:hypothetical protein
MIYMQPTSDFDLHSTSTIVGREFARHVAA